MSVHHVFRGGLALVFAVTLFVRPALADERAFYPQDVTFDAAIQAPEDFLGHRFGDEPIRHHAMVSYLKMLGEQSDRIKVETIGYSHERRPILFLTITSPKNHARIDAIKAAHMKLTDPANTTRPSADMPVVTWLNYGVHGAEASGMDASVPIAYHLAAATGPEIEKTLDESVILITAVFNPDGHSRRIAWLDQHSSKVSNKNAENREHNVAWPGGRTNHYWFDLNRQWLLLSQPEARAWMKKWHEWKPNLTVDYHEMGKDSTYYFHPGVPTRTFPRVPKGAISLMYDYAEHPVDFMDRDAQLFFNEEGFDNFYIGKGSTFPLVNGSLGILYEAGRSEASEVNTINGVKTYRENIRTHYRTSLSSIAAGQKLRPKFLDYQQGFYKSALDLARKDRVKGYVFSSNGDKARMAHFLDVLTYHGIKVKAVTRDLQVGKNTYRAGDAFVVDLNQKQYRLIRSVFERITKFEDHIFYDVSTWTLPLSFDLDHDELTGSQFRAHLGGEVQPELPTAKAPQKAELAYLFDWTEYYAPRALNRLLEAGVITKVNHRPVRVKTTGGEVDLRRGSIMVPVDKQTVSMDRIHAIMETIAKDDGVTVHSATSGWTPVGPQLGSRDHSRTVNKINPLLVVGDGVSPYDAGEVWHLLDYRMNIGVNLRDLNTLSGVTLADYTHIILPQGRYGALGDKMNARIADWVNAGGTLVAMGTGAIYAEKTFLEREADQNLLPITPVDRASYADKAPDEALHIIGGAILGADMDVTHPLAFGYDDRAIPGHRRGTHILATPKNVYATVAKYNEAPLLSGYVSQANRDRIGGSPMIVAERKGKGSVVLFADNPNFRGIWYGTNKLFLNALFFSKAFNAPRRVGEEAEAVEE